ncbi:hypothetical protein BDE36_1460 [Arcticibacter tournemirensis]|uniref:Uncharacterized protein n=1 Tax=Arcticibacter tournemirensis TaxID=699437 RepID=A0A5M9HC45_9SPHI|nr:hypothetical protein [Arcticibacter tournemirensis]KAA8482884.1 hypothetical protein F1649_10380 [Arcticibacter tournemirensis]TQM49735.1 hypothetical protein BDE36_1460 [Arcticibacter tournemirensis]
MRFRRLVKQKHVTVTVFILVTGLVSCGHKKALPNDYIGDWKSVDTMDYNIAITIQSKKNATNFIIKDKTNSSVAELPGRYNAGGNRFELDGLKYSNILKGFSNFQSAELVGDTMLFTVNERIVKMVRQDL